jgi:phosphopantetheinyl transferase
MPLLKEWNVGLSGLAAIWKIEEQESFFNAYTGMYPEINNDKRRIEHLAGRFLLKHLEQDFPLHLIVRDEHNKPRLDNNSFYFSVSHSWPYIAAIIDTQKDTGIDIQVWNPRITDIQFKFLSDTERAFCKDDYKLFTIAWCAKEAGYKWYGKKGVISFKNHLPIDVFQQTADNNYDLNINFQLTQVPVNMSLHGVVADEYGCVWLERVGG